MVVHDFILNTQRATTKFRSYVNMFEDNFKTCRNHSKPFQNIFSVFSKIASKLTPMLVSFNLFLRNIIHIKSQKPCLFNNSFVRFLFLVKILDLNRQKLRCRSYSW